MRENTIASLKTASHHGADMVEFDVQLSKDHIPVIYHDFYVSISLKRKKQIEAMDMLEIPVKDLTLEQLHLLKVYSTHLHVHYTQNLYMCKIIYIIFIDVVCSLPYPYFFTDHEYHPNGLSEFYFIFYCEISVF